MNASMMKHEQIWAERKLRNGESGGDIAPKLARLIHEGYRYDLEKSCQLADEIVNNARAAVREQQR